MILTLSLRERNFDILDALTRMTRRMVEGEIMQLSLIGDSRITEAQHLDIVERKTAYMFSVFSEIGGIVAVRAFAGEFDNERRLHERLDLLEL